MSRPALLGVWLLCQLCHLIASVQMLVAIVTGSRRAWTLAMSYDQTGNVVLGGDEDTLISARAWASRDKWRWRWLVRLLDKIDNGHCYRVWLGEERKRGGGVHNESSV